MPRPQVFPDLPVCPPTLASWPAGVLEGYNHICDAYNHASTLLRQEESDPLRLRINSERLLSRSIPLLKAMDAQMRGCRAWNLSSAGAMIALITELNSAAENADAVFVLTIDDDRTVSDYTCSEGTRVTRLNPVSILYQGRHRGRPKKVIEEAWL